ncbi:DUF2066 domain-containing protein [Dokdonella sp.]|uniref:DUF2066 domain-containing protein n=1 Tax=Dokdonella sp. TaxID=2291710 RepID=UPI0025BA1F9C|nr:DUF2066 domain-containing protein [Dokdonella sp.]
MSRLPCLFVLFALLALARLVHAAPETYTGIAPVNGQGEDERAAALKTALANVVIEQTADATILSRADVASAVAQASRYVLQYGYERNSSGAAPLQLVAQFDRGAVDAMLAQLGLRAAAPTANAGTSQARVWIGGLRNADDWLRVAGFLAHDPAVRDSRPLFAHDDGVLMQLTLAGGLAAFLDAVSGKGMLEVEQGAAAGTDAEATLVLKP